MFRTMIGLIMVAACAASAVGQFTPSFDFLPDNGGDGSDGAFNSFGNPVLDTTNQAVYQFTSFVVQVGHTVSIIGSSPAVIKVSGVVQINGTLELNGCPGFFNVGGVGGPGGGNGGAANTSGSGPGGGGFASGGSNCTMGSGPLAGPVLGLAQAGSGGGGGTSDGGGGGGGSLILLSNDSIFVGGSILANGGGPEPTMSVPGPGGGSGGRIVLGAPFVTNFGLLSARGGQPMPSNAGSAGGDGCIEIWSNNYFPGTSMPLEAVSGTKAYVSDLCPQSSIGLGFASTPSQSDPVTLFFSDGLLTNPISIPGTSNPIELDTTSFLFDPAGSNTLFPYIPTNTGMVNFFMRTDFAIDVSPAVAVLTSTGQAVDVDVFTQAVKWGPTGLVDDISERATIHFEHGR